MQSLKKNISLSALVSLGAGGVIGSSWIYTNSRFFKTYGAGGEIFGLLVAAILAILVSLSFAELSTTFPKAGGEVVWGYAAFGKVGALFSGWALIGAYISILSFFVMAFGFLISSIFPQIAVGPYYIFIGTKVYWLELSLGVLITFLVFLINYFGAKLTGNIQIILFALLIILGLGLVIVGFLRGKPSNFIPSFYQGQNHFWSIFRFLLPAMTFLTGWESVATMAEEAKMTSKKIGITVILSIVIAAIYYILVLLSSAWIFPWKATTHMQMGTIDAFKSAGYPILSVFAYIISFLGLATSTLTLFTAASRLVFSLARGKILPAYFSKIHPKYHTPTRAIWLVFILILALGWIGEGGLTYFLDMGGFLIALVWSFSSLCLWEIRYQYPGLYGSFYNKHLFFPLMGGLIALVVALVTLIPKTPISLVWPYEYVILGIWCLLGAISYGLKKNQTRKFPQNLWVLI